MKIRHLFLVSFLMVTVSMLTGWRSHRHHKKNKVENEVTQSATPKTLDLSLPLKIEDKTESSMSQAKIDKPKKIRRDVELNTQAIMSIEPEADKIKSFDGAAITINVKR